MSADLSARDWSTDYDIFDPAYVTEPYPIWDALRRTCPIAHSDRYGASWLPTRYDDVAAIARDVEHFSSR
ncbi:MAG: cytochrome P450, partial [Ilumatobacteraceae bacterium]